MHVPGIPSAAKPRPAPPPKAHERNQPQRVRRVCPDHPEKCDESRPPCLHAQASTRCAAQPAPDCKRVSSTAPTVLFRNARPAYSRQSLNSISVCVCPLLPFPWPKRGTRSPSGPIGSAGMQNGRQPTPCRQCPTGADRARAPTRHQRSHCQVARHAQAQSREC